MMALLTLKEKCDYLEEGHASVKFNFWKKKKKKIAYSRESSVEFLARACANASTPSDPITLSPTL